MGLLLKSLTKLGGRGGGILNKLISGGGGRGGGGRGGGGRGGGGRGGGGGRLGGRFNLFDQFTNDYDSDYLAQSETEGEKLSNKL